MCQGVLTIYPICEVGIRTHDQIAQHRDRNDLSQFVSPSEVHEFRFPTNFSYFKIKTWIKASLDQGRHFRDLWSQPNFPQIFGKKIDPRDFGFRLHQLSLAAVISSCFATIFLFQKCYAVAFWVKDFFVLVKKNLLLLFCFQNLVFHRKGSKVKNLDVISWPHFCAIWLAEIVSRDSMQPIESPKFTLSCENS